MSQTIRQLRALAEQLEELSDSPQLDVDLLLSKVLDRPTSYLMTWPSKALEQAQLSEFEALLARRKSGEPVAYLLGAQAFWTLDLEVSTETLIPRADTETLVEQALQLSLPSQARVLDLGTGTGAIALALASERASWQISGVDRVLAAVELARRNAERNNLSRVSFAQGSWFEPVAGQLYELIVSNPPYIDPADPHLSQGDVRFEPASALIADEQGMADIRWIAERAREHLVVGGWLMFEHGYDQGLACQALLTSLGYTDVSCQQDLGARDRVTMGCWRG